MISKQPKEAVALAREAKARHRSRQLDMQRLGAEGCAATSGRTKSEDHQLMEQVVERSNLRLAYQRVVENKGAPGVDNVTVSEFKDWLKENWPSVKQALLDGRYLPRLVRRVDIPPSGGMRTLGVPTVVDRLIQQALHQVLQPLFELTFSDGSYGFRPGRGAHQAVRKAQGYIREGKRWVVDLDLEKFFDRVNHDVLMARVAREVSDARVLKLIRRFLEAGMMSEGLAEPRTQGCLVKRSIRCRNGTGSSLPASSRLGHMCRHAWPHNPLYGLENGHSASIAVIGNEGKVRLAFARTLNDRTLRMKAHYMKHEFNLVAPVMHLMLWYTRALITQMAQTPVCNR